MPSDGRKYLTFSEREWEMLIERFGSPKGIKAAMLRGSPTPSRQPVKENEDKKVVGPAANKLFSGTNAPYCVDCGLEGQNVDNGFGRRRRCAKCQGAFSKGE